MTIVQGELPKGFFVSKPRDGAPSFVKGSMSVRLDEAKEYLNTLHANEKGYVNFDILESQKGNYYLKLNTWTPDASKSGGKAPVKQEFVDDQIIPF
jgi:hypothetical protein